MFSGAGRVRFELQRGGGGGARGPAPATRRASREIAGWPETSKHTVSQAWTMDMLHVVVDGALCSTRDSKSYQHKKKGPDSGPNVCRGRGNSSNVIPGPRQPGQLKERAGFLVSRSSKLSAAPPWAGRRYSTILLVSPKKKKTLLVVFGTGAITSYISAIFSLKARYYTGKLCSLLTLSENQFC